MAGLDPAAEPVRAQALRVLRASLPERRHSMHGWDEDLWDAYNDRDDHTLDEADAWLIRLMPTTDDVTRDRVAEAVGKWAELGIPTASSPPTPEQIDTVAGEWSTSVRQSLASEAFDFLARAAADGRLTETENEDVVRLAQAYVVRGLAVGPAVHLLHDLGSPTGERALLDLVRDEEVGDFRPDVRHQLLSLRQPGYAARAAEPLGDEEPLLPLALRTFPYSWDTAFDWGTTPPDETALTRARAVLEAAVDLPPGGPPRPAWQPMRQVVRALLPHPRLVTRERMAEARQECERLGYDLHGTDTRTFAAHWCERIVDTAVAATFRWLSDLPCDSRQELTAAHWAPALAERVARRGLAVEEAIWFLHRTDADAASREALICLATDSALPSATRETAAQWVE